MKFVNYRFEKTIESEFSYFKEIVVTDNSQTFAKEFDLKLFNRDPSILPCKLLTNYLFIISTVSMYQKFASY